MIINIILALLAITTLIILICLNKPEEFRGSHIQLYTKGPEDLYTMGNVAKHVPDFRWINGSAPDAIWSNPTRLPLYYNGLKGFYLDPVSKRNVVPDMRKTYDLREYNTYPYVWW